MASTNVIDVRTPSPSPPPLPRRHYSQRTTERDRIRIHILRAQAHYSYAAIARRLQLTPRAVQYAIHSPETPTPRRGHSPRLNDAQLDELIDYISANQENRRESYEGLAAVFGCGIKAIRNGLKRRGYKRYISLSKPALTERHKIARLQWAYTHRTWSFDDWCTILWSDETWTTTTHHRKTWITRRQDEAYHADCVNVRSPSSSNWMFWGSFYGVTKGPGFFWERKEWGTITGLSYIAHTLPHVYETIEYVRLIDRCIANRT